MNFRTSCNITIYAFFVNRLLFHAKNKFHKFSWNRGYNLTLSLDDEKLREIKTFIEILKEKFQKNISFRVLETKKSNANDVFIRFLEKYNLKTEFIYDFIQMFH